MKGTKYMKKGGAMKGTKYMAKGGSMKGTKYMAGGGSLVAKERAQGFGSVGSEVAKKIGMSALGPILSPKTVTTAGLAGGLLGGTAAKAFGRAAKKTDSVRGKIKGKK